MNKRIACITLDIEPDIGDRQRRTRLLDSDNLSRRYGDVICRQKVRVTGFVVTSLLDRYGTALAQLEKDIPIEFGLHSHSHDYQNACSRVEIERSLDAFRSFWGIDPGGYRAPFGLISKMGVDSLMDMGFRYDSSIFPSVRLGKYRYWNLRFPAAPFRFVRDQASLLELPFASLARIHLVFSLSRVKLLGLGLYQMLIKLFPLPDVVILDSHPYDFYVPLIAAGIEGLERYAHLRNGQRAFSLFERMIEMLRAQGYEFMYMSELCEYMHRRPGLEQVDVRNWT